jgi:hypothetical protein
MKQFWLADYKNMNQYGWSMEIKLLDGPHTDSKGVREAQHIISGIGLDKGKDRNYVMVVIEDIPDGTIDVNEEAIDTCKKIINPTP